MQEEPKEEAMEEDTGEMEHADQAETSFNEDSWEPEPTNSKEAAAGPSFADILVAPKYANLFLHVILAEKPSIF